MWSMFEEGTDVAMQGDKDYGRLEEKEAQRCIKFPI